MFSHVCNPRKPKRLAMYYTRSQCHTLHTLLIRAPRFTTKKTLITPNDNRIKSSSPDLSFKSFIRGGIYKQTVD